MYLIIFIAIIFVLFYQNSRISKIESLFKKNAVTPADPITNPINSIPVQTEPIQKTNTQVNNDISSEEVSGRILGRIGIAAVVIGVGFFLKYAFDNNWVSFAGRIIIGILIGIIVMAIGQYLRKKYLQYSDLLIGGGMAIIYLSIFASYALYHLVDPMLAFLGMILITIVGVILSITNATITLAFVAFIGGFITPILIGVNDLGEWITLTYITILNAGILGILLYKKWTNLVLVGLIGTWIIFSGWLATSYNQELLIPTLLFILVQFLIFTASSVFRIIVEKLKANPIDYFVITTTALSFAMVCYNLLMPEYKHYTSLGAVLVAGFYIIIALMAYRENPSDKSINIFLPGIAVCFLTVAVPIEFSGPWISAWWFVQSIVLYILASTSSSRGFQIMGVLVYILGLFNLMYYITTYSRPANFVIFFNGPFIMLMMAVIIAYAIALFYHRYGSVSTEIQKRGVNAFVIIANILTLYALTTQVGIYYELGNGNNYANIKNWSNTSISILWALYAVILTTIGFMNKFASLRIMGLVLFIITAFKVVIDVWSLGEIYRIISFIIFGVIALTASFIYVKYKERLISNI